MPDSSNYLHPEAIRRISRLDLRARHIVEGFLSGMHRSPHFGQSVEFAQHREYSPGDDLRHVDWQVWARQDRLYVKQFESDTNMRVNLLVDVSSSMAYGEDAGDSSWSKFDYAATVAVSLAYLVLKQQDAIGCLTFDEAVRERIPTLSRKTQMSAIMDSLRTHSAAGKTDLASILGRAAEIFPKRGMMIVVSDFFGDVEQTLKGLRLLRQRGHDVLALQILDDDEIDFPFTGATRFVGLESDDRLRCNPKTLRDGYLTAMNTFLDRLRRGCAGSGVDYRLIRTSEPLDAALASFLSQRQS